MGTMSPPWASSQARASWLRAMPWPAASASSWLSALRFFAKFSPCQQRGDRLHGAGAADRLRAGLAQGEVAGLARVDELPHGARDVLDRHVRVDAVLVEHVDVIGAEVAQAVVGDLEDVPGPAVDAARPGAGQVEAELGGGHDLVAERRDRLAD
jgi:hypothetical protein